MLTIPKLIAGVALLLTVLPNGAAAATPSRPPRVAATAAATSPATAHYAGWAMDAYPGDSVAYLKGEMARQLAAGANVVWLGHNNSGDVIPGKVEPALSYAVWAAYRDPGARYHDLAVAMVAAQRNALDAARALGVRVILPVGYQTQMGAAWNLAHPGDDRRTADGRLYNGPKPGDIGASFYAPDYRRDITAYYRWVDATLVRPYTGTVMMLNLADEPKDGDYSSWADAAFRAAHGYGLHDAGASAARQEAVGRFESEYVNDYAIWSARQWLAIDPGVTVTMSYCGGYGRVMHEGPNLESIFQKAPRNFVVTFDAYPRDGLYTTPLTEPDLIALFALVRTLGYYSAIYHRPLWLWSTGNSWGLNEGSPDRGTVADAVANGIYIRNWRGRPAATCKASPSGTTTSRAKGSTTTPTTRSITRTICSGVSRRASPCCVPSWPRPQGSPTPSYWRRTAPIYARLAHPSPCAPPTPIGGRPSASWPGPMCPRSP